MWLVSSGFSPGFVQVWGGLGNKSYEWQVQAAPEVLFCLCLWKPWVQVCLFADIPVCRTVLLKPEISQCWGKPWSWKNVGTLSALWRHLRFMRSIPISQCLCQPESPVPSAIQTCTIKGKTPLSAVLVMVLVPLVAVTWVWLHWMCQVLIMPGSRSLGWSQEKRSVASAAAYALWQW